MRTAVRALQVTGPLPPQTCWERYDDLAQWSQWAPHITGVDAAENRLARGLRGMVRVTGGFGLPFAVTELDRPGRTWSWIVRLGPVALTLHHRIDIDPAGTRASLTIEGPTALVIAYAPLARFALLRLVRPSTSSGSGPTGSGSGPTGSGSGRTGSGNG